MPLAAFVTPVGNGVAGALTVSVTATLCGLLPAPAADTVIAPV